MYSGCQATLVMCNRRRTHEGQHTVRIMMSVSWPNVDRQLGFNVGVPGVSDLRWCAVNRCRWRRQEKVADLFWKVGLRLKLGTALRERQRLRKFIANPTLRRKRSRMIT
jgi:hypothetical protein